jgi:hypothetical protein
LPGQHGAADERAGQLLPRRQAGLLDQRAGGREPARVAGLGRDRRGSTPGYPDGNWPPRSGMTLEKNLTDLRRHAEDFTRGAGFTFTVLDPGDNDVIGCVYLYPSPSKEWDVTVQSWVGRTDRASTYHSPMPSRAGSPPTGPGSVWTAAVAES